MGEGRGEGEPYWFMESLLSLLRMHWDHEPNRGREGGGGRFEVRFMERSLARNPGLEDTVPLGLL